MFIITMAKTGKRNQEVADTPTCVAEHTPTTTRVWSWHIIRHMFWWMLEQELRIYESHECSNASFWLQVTMWQLWVTYSSMPCPAHLFSPLSGAALINGSDDSSLHDKKKKKLQYLMGLDPTIICSLRISYWTTLSHSHNLVPDKKKSQSGSLNLGRYITKTEVEIMFTCLNKP